MSKLEILENRIVSGYLPGLRQPASICVLRVDNALLRQLPLSALAAALTGHLAALVHREERPATPAGLGQFILDVIAALMEEVFVPLLEPCQLLYWEEGTSCRLQVIVPVPDAQQRAPNQTLVWLETVLNRREPDLGSADLKHLQSLLLNFRAQAPQGGMTKRLLAAAFADDIPWLHYTSNVYQFGWGANSRLLDGTFTDSTGAMATRLARNKASASHVMRMAGFPVPRQQIVGGPEEAVKAADRFGYPVVIKPADLDGGHGVAAGLTNAAAVRKAYAVARKMSPNVLLEKHVHGQDYRVYVMHGKALRVVLRVPAGVTGDGHRAVRELLVEANKDPRRQPAAERLKQLTLDEEALELLTEQGLDADAVPAQGQFVRLHRAANIAGGGTPVMIDLNKAHPDNLLLCERAARLLRLDLAGIDFLIPDIGGSWRAGGAAICEVNAQPLLPPDLPAVIMKAMVRGNGRIPVVVIIDDPGPVGWLQEVLQSLQAAGRHAGCAVGPELSSGGFIIHREVANAAQAAHILLRDPAVDVALFRLHDSETLKNGFPVDRCDVLVLAGGRGFGGEHAAVAKVLMAGKPRVLVNADAGLWQLLSGQPWTQDERTERVAFTKLGARLLNLLGEITGE